MSVTQEFDPAVNGWFFENWGEASPYCIGSCEFSWDLFRRTYLGINPTHDCVEAPLDCAFYEIFKNCAQQGNCGGMSLLGLALFKYGGYMGFCSPACFYTGGKSPDRDDLHWAINILQARQFSAPGIENFLDVVGAGNLSNAEGAYNKIKACLGSGDYALLSIATDLWGGSAHTVIPYKVDDNPAGYASGTKLIYVWDPNYPYDDHPNYYLNRQNVVVINSAYDWRYLQGAGAGTDYHGTGIGTTWCFAIPMSVVLHKARHPLAVDMVIEGLTTLFVSGPGAAVAQIEDESGRRYYREDAEEHILCTDIETDLGQLLPDIVRWPWFAQSEDGRPVGELYFLRRSPASPALKISLYGENYRLMYAQAGNLVDITVKGRRQERARDVVGLVGVATNQQALTVETHGEGRLYDIQKLRRFPEGGGWRSVALQNLRLSTGGLRIHTAGDLQNVEVSSLERQLNFDMELKQYRAQALSTQALGRQRAVGGRTVRFSPQNWNDLKSTEVKREFFQNKSR